MPMTRPNSPQLGEKPTDGYGSSEDTTRIRVFAPDLYGDGYIDPVYQAKARMLGHAIQEIGMGRYQWYLFVVTGFGRLADGIWPAVASVILAPAVYEFHFNAPLLSLGISIGLLVGAIFWGIGCDIWGRRWSFNLTLLATAVFGLAAGGSPNFVSLASLLTITCAGVGGDLSVDSPAFLEFIPGSHQYLLTIQTMWWSLGQLIRSLVAWPLISKFSCSSAVGCEKSGNMGWRYLLYVLGVFTFFLWGCRFFAFTLLESPRFLSGIGKDKEAVDVIYQLAKYNGKTTTLSVEELEVPGQIQDGSPSQPRRNALSEASKRHAGHIKALFATPKMALSTSLLISVWALTGLSSMLYNNFLPYLLTIRGAEFEDASLYITYRNQVILCAVGVVATLFSGWIVEVPYLGRRGSLAISLVSTGAFLLASTVSKTSNQLLGWNCGYTFCSNAAHAVLYAITAEIFPAKDRGTGNGLTATATCVTGVMAPVIALYANLETQVPVYIAGGIILLAGLLAILLPYEPRGKASI